ncbi:acyl-CoA dehydrogenase family protein [Dongia sp.]|uniref:acyl-CoA dehydrogenase family protein n=1 Tax=Dongia sp. TaxID=1977262 RepID=UPI0035ADD7F1
MHDLVTATAHRLFSAYTPTLVRALEAGVPDPVWAEIEASGFLDLLAGENGDGETAFAALLPLLFAAGYHGVPAPIGDTVLLRGALAGKAPAGSIAIERPLQACGYRPDWFLAGDDVGMFLISADRQASGGRLSPGIDCLALGAMASALTMAGAMERIRDMTLQYAKDRQQFGRPIATFQAIQQMISQMVEQVALAVAAAGIACNAQKSVRDIDRTRVGIAKTVIGSAAARVAEIAHAVHGAIGMAEECDLHIYTRILQRERLAFGGELYWARAVGRVVLATDRPYLLDFARSLEAQHDAGV